MKNLKKWLPYLMVLPVISILLVVFISGISEALLQSLGYFPFINMHSFTLKFYKEIFTEKDFINSLLFTLYIAFVSALFSVIMGLFLARIVSSFRLKNDYIFHIPIIIPQITVALFAITLLSDTGLFARIFYFFGWDYKIFDNLVYSSNGSSIILAFLWKEIPYVMFSCLSIMKNNSFKYEKAAINLGACKFYAFRKVTLPMIINTVISTFTIVFSFAFGSYELYYLLGSTKPKALAVKALIEYNNPVMENRPKAMAVNMVMIFFVVLFVIVFDYIIKRIILGKNYEK